MLKRFPLRTTLLTVGMLANPGFGADADHLNPALGRILERHGIVGNATLERNARASELSNVISASAGEAQAVFSGTDAIPLHPDEPRPGPAVHGMILRFADAQAKALSAQNLPPPDWLLNDISAVVPSLHFKRAMSMGNFVFDFPEPITWQTYQELKEVLQGLGIVESIAPDTIANVNLVPNNPYFYYQWNLLETGTYSASAESSIFGINAIDAWDLVLESNAITVAVLDSGISDPPPLESQRVLTGYDFITNTERSRDGDGRDPDPLDNGNYRAADECSEYPLERSSTWHGTQMMSIIAAPGNTGGGIAGVDWEANILPVRVLGPCGGATSDIVEGMFWSVGYPVPGVPQNENPARIMNLSLGSLTEEGCSEFHQDVFNALGLFGVVMVASAGNDDSEAFFNEPSGCLGPISVGATDHKGERASYSNWSTRGAVDISAPGGDFDRYGNKGRLVAIADSGTSEPTGELITRYTEGTSAAAALVSGALSLAMRLDPLQHSDLLVSIMLETAQPFGPGSECENEYPKCGVGILDLEALIQGALLFKGYAVVRDFYEPDLQHYFRSGNWDEVSLVVSGQFGNWDEFDDLFLAWRDNKVIGTHPVCRFYGTPGIGPNSHFYTVDNNECEFIKQNDPGWTYEGVAFYAKKAYSTGGCPRATNPVYRYYNQKAHLNDSNHRYTTHLDDRESMEALGWVMEGTAMCVPEF